MPKLNSSKQQLREIEGIEVKLVRARQKRINLRISSTGEVRLSYPLHASEAEAIAFFMSKLGWVRERVARARQNEAASHPVESGVGLLWGRRMELRVVADAARKRPKVEVVGGAIVFLVPPELATPEAEQERQKLLERFWASELNEVLPSVASRMEERCGKRASRWRVRLMSSRWGSCNTKTASITISTALVQYPIQCLEQVVVHELCHLYEGGHNERFYALMDRFYPAWREARAILKAGVGAL